MIADLQIATLAHPFETGVLDPPGPEDRILCIGFAEPFSPAGSGAVYVQGMRPDYLRLERAGCRVMPELPDGEFDFALIRLGRHRGQNEAWIAAALCLVRRGGRIVAAGGRTDGAASLRKRLAGLGCAIAHASKNHGVVFWLAVGDDREALAAKIEPAPEPPVDGRFLTAPGMFSHGRIDPGSRLLADNIDCEGTVTAADFCAGWGYFSARLVERCPKMRLLHLYEAEHAALEAAKDNLGAPQHLETGFYWRDLLREPVAESYDLIVMNPPFHDGRKADPGIGRRLIETAAKALRPRGRLVMVANRQLPYEQSLKAGFSSWVMLAEEDGYKVLSAVR